MSNTRSNYGLAAAISLSVMSFGSPVFAGSGCGPGEHWVDDCPAGRMVVPFAQKVQIRVPCDSTAPTLILRGPLKVQREAGVVGESTHYLEEEPVFLRFSGHGVTLRAGVEQGVTGSWAIVTELADPTLAMYHAEYFFEVDGTSLGTLHTQDACVMEGILDRLPPINSAAPYPSEQPCLDMTNLPLYDEDNQEVGCLVLDGLD